MSMSAESNAIQQAAAEFIRERHRLSAYVIGLLRDVHAAEDVLQEVWVLLAAEVEKGIVFENQSAWCRGVARNLVRRHWERRQTAKVIADSSLLDAFLERVDLAFAEADQNEADDWSARRQALQHCVAKLPERSRRLLALRYETRASMEEVARELGRSFDAVTKALYRLRQSLLLCVQRKLKSLTA
jgi:RNA polymerase sigma-70 factor (ECF subfamily)